MTIEEVLQNVEIFGLDTSPFIYFVESDPKYHPYVEPIFKGCEQKILMAVTSVLTLTEVLVHPLRIHDIQLTTNYKNLLMSSINISSHHITENIALRAAELRAKYRIKTPDAIQLATAISEGCEAFLTNDRDLQRVTDIPVIVFDELTL